MTGRLSLLMACLALFTGTAYAGDCSFPMYTPDEYLYLDSGLEGSQMTSMTFEYQGCSNAHIALYKSFGDMNENIYEIVIGGLENTVSSIRLSQQGTDEVEEITNDILSCTESRTFWLDWSKNGDKRSLRVGTGSNIGSETFMSYDDDSPFDVQYIGISSGFGSDGTWALDGYCREPDCQADIGFALDISKSVTSNVWEDITVPFVTTMMSRFNVGQDAVRYAAISFNDTAYYDFGLNEAASAEAAKALLEKIVYHRGPTCVACGLEYIYTKIFVEENGDRSDVDDYVIVVTDAVSTVQANNVNKHCTALHDAGIESFVLAIEGEVAPNFKTMKKIGSDEEHVFTAANAAQLTTAVVKLINHICPPYTDPCSNNPCENGGTCITGFDGVSFSCECATGFAGDTCEFTCEKSDISIILDSSTSIKGTRWRNTVLPFVKEFIHHFNIGPQETQFGCVTFSHYSEVDFHLNTHTTESSLDAAVEELDYHRSLTCITCGLRTAREEIFQESNGDRPDVPNIAIVFTDGKANVEQEDLAAEAERLRNESNALVFVVATTGSVNMTEASTIASDPDSSFLLKVDNFGDLLDAANDIATLSCAITEEMIGSRRRRSLVGHAALKYRSKSARKMVERRKQRRAIKQRAKRSLAK